MTHTLVGRPGDLVPSDALVDAYTTRIGGTPVLPADTGCMPEYLCSHCRQPLLLLLQTHAPLSADQAGKTVQDRFLYLLGCARDACPGSWRAFRCQLPSDARTPPTSGGDAGQRTQGQPDDGRAAAAVESTWGGAAEPDTWGGAAAADWGGATDGAAGWGDEIAVTAGDSSVFDFDDLNAALDAAQSAAPAVPRAAAVPQAPPVELGAPGPRAAQAQAQGCYAGPSFASFYLSAEPEPRCSAAKLDQREREHVQQLLLQYERDDGEAGASVEPPTAAGACLPAVEGGCESWGEEGYEPDAVLQAPDKSRSAGGSGASTSAAASLRPAFIKFAKRLAACPDQCARYSFGGSPLWPGEAAPAPAPCTACGAPAVFELQLMAPAIYYLEESADWLEQEAACDEEAGKAGEERGGEAGSAGAVLRPPSSWEWATVAVYSCSRSCAPPPGAGLFVEEQAFAESE